LKKALIIQNKFVGDVLVASLLAKNIKKIYPEIKVHFFCYDKAVGILDNNPYIDKIISFNNEELKKISNLWEMSTKIRAEKYDILFDPYAKLQSRFITLRSDAKKKISFDKPFFKYIYTDVIKEYKTPKYAFCTSIEDRMKLLTPFNPDFSTLDFQTEIFLTEKEIKKTRIELEKNGVDFSKKIIILGVLGSEDKKTLPLHIMSEIVNFILENYDGNILFNYVPNQQKEVDFLLKLIPNRDKIITSVLGNSIREFAAILYHSDCLIANEGGSINIAKAMQKPTFSIFSPHKFRKDWGCYENFSRNRSFHIQDIYPEVNKVLKTGDLIKNPFEIYPLMSAYYIVPKIEEFLNEEIFHTNKIANKKFSKNALTAVMICYNEEKNIRKYIENMAFVDELIIVDSFSTDKTIEIIKQYPFVKLVQKKFVDFPNQKNYALSLASNEWILFFDADERINTELKVEILQTINTNPNVNAYYIKRKFYFKNKAMQFSGWQNDKAIRLFKKGKCKYNEDRKVHEIMSTEGNVGTLNNKLDHYSFESVKKYKKKLNLYAQLKAEELFNQGIKPNFFHFKIKPIFRFFHHYIFRLGILDGKNGYKISKIYENYVRNRYKYLAEMYKK